MTYQVQDISPSMSFIEMLDVVNHELTLKGEEPVAFEYDCREGICGSCSLVIDGVPHGPDRGTVCQLYMRRFPDGATITIEPWRARPFRSSRISSWIEAHLTASCKPEGISPSIRAEPWTATCC